MPDSEDDNDDELIPITVKIHPAYIEKIKELKKKGPYATRSEIIRRALHEWLEFGDEWLEFKETKKRERERELKK